MSIIHNLFNGFNRIGKEVPSPKEVSRIPKELKNISENNKLNQIMIRYFDRDFRNSSDILGEITHEAGYPLILFEKPFKGCVLLLNDVVYNNWSKDGEKTIDITEDYPFGIDHKSDLVKYGNVEYYNSINKIKKDLTKEKNSTDMYYKKEYKFYIPQMLNKIPLPIIKLDNAERYNPIDITQSKRLANISQSFLRQYLGIKLMERTTNKSTTGMFFVAILFFAIGFFVSSLIGKFV